MLRQGLSVHLLVYWKLIVGAFYRPLDNLKQPMDDFESIISYVFLKFKNNPNCIVIFGSNFSARNIDWDSNTVHEHNITF